MKTFRVNVNTSGRYDGIWDTDMFTDCFVMDDCCAPHDVAYEAASYLWETLDSSQIAEFEEQGIECVSDMFNKWAWEILIIHSDGTTEYYGYV